jgi:hypothetical protein
VRAKGKFFSNGKSLNDFILLFILLVKNTTIKKQVKRIQALVIDAKFEFEL